MSNHRQEKSLFIARLIFKIQILIPLGWQQYEKRISTTHRYTHRIASVHHERRTEHCNKWKTNTCVLRVLSLLRFFSYCILMTFISSSFFNLQSVKILFHVAVNDIKSISQFVLTPLVNDHYLIKVTQIQVYAFTCLIQINSGVKFLDP